MFCKLYLFFPRIATYPQQWHNKGCRESQLTSGKMEVAFCQMYMFAFLTKVTIYLLTSCNTEERIAQNIYIHNSNRNYKKSTTTTILIKKRIGIGYKNYGKQCPGLEFRLIPKLISWAGLKPKKI